MSQHDKKYKNKNSVATATEETPKRIMKPQVVEYARDRYLEEQQRFDHVENKCGRLMSFITILITVVSGMFAFFSESLFEIKQPLDILILITSIVSVFVLICAWGHALLSLKIGTVNIAPRKNENINYMLESSDDDMHQHMINCYLDPIKKLKPKIDEKALYLRYSYDELGLAGFSLSLLLLLTLIRELTN